MSKRTRADDTAKSFETTEQAVNLLIDAVRHPAIKYDRAEATRFVNALEDLGVIKIKASGAKRD